MAKLDENYLDFVRNTLYSKPNAGKNSVCPPLKSNKSVKKKKQQESIQNADENIKNSNVKHEEPYEIDPKDCGKHHIQKSVQSRICTPYKTYTNNNGSLSVTTENVSPSRSNSSSDSKPKKRGTKRQHSSSDSSNVNIKKKREKQATSGIKLIFEDDGDNVDVMEGNSNMSSFKFKKKLHMKKEIKNDMETDKQITENHSSSSQMFQNKLQNDEIKVSEEILPLPKSLKFDKHSDTEKSVDSFTGQFKISKNSSNSNSVKTHKQQKDTNGSIASSSYGFKEIDKLSLGVTEHRHRKHEISLKHSKKKKKEMCPLNNDTKSVVESTLLPDNSCLPSTEEAADFYDNKKVTVKGMKFYRFCTLFPPSDNEQRQAMNNTHFVPKKHYKVDQNDVTEWPIEESIDPHVGEIAEKEENQTVSKLNVDDTNSKHSSDENIQKLNNVLDDTISNSNTEKLNIAENIAQDSEKHIKNSNKAGISQRAKDISELSNKQNEEELLENNSSEDSYEHTSDGATENSEALQNRTENYDTNSGEVLILKNGDRILILNKNESVYFNGLCCLEVLNGEIEILGACLNKNSGQQKIYSPRGTSLLYLKNRCTLFDDNKVQLNHLISENLLNADHVNMIFEGHCAVLLCKELKEPSIEFIESHIPQQIFPGLTASGPRIDFELSGSWNKINTSDSWEDIIENIPEQTKTVICGGKGVGKSTFLRFSVNVLLRKFKKIRVLDLDPGQSEFHPPGSVGAVTVENSLFGPNYTHLQPPDRMILSHINMGSNVKHYLKAIKYLWDLMEATESLPTLINFPGFTQGMGLDIAVSTLKILHPTLVIEIKSKTYSKNYKMDMTSENVNSYDDNKILSPDEPCDNLLTYDFVKLDSLSEKSEAWILEARQSREMCILSYFGKMMSENVKDLTSSAISMYSINISELTVTCSEGKPISPLAINGNLVALCSTVHNNDTELFISYGFGFVRGIDLETDTLVLLTPEPIEQLENVTHLVLSSVTTPPSLIMSATAVRGHIPYVNVGELVDFGQFTKRSYLPPKK